MDVKTIHPLLLIDGETGYYGAPYLYYTVAAINDIMAIIHSCCCWKSLRTGSFACGIYSLIYYSFLVVAGTLHVESWGTPFDNNTVALSLGQDTQVAHPVSIAIIICSAMAILASINLIIGLRMDNRIMLIPWIFIISLTTLVDLLYTIYSIGTTVIYPELAAIVTIDFFICLLNVYCVLCVVSQYQEYKAGRGTALHNLQLQRFGGPVDFTTNGDVVQFRQKRRTNQCSSQSKLQPPPPPSSSNYRRVSQPAAHVNGHHHQPHVVTVLCPISECSNSDEVQLNSSFATGEDRTSEEMAGRDDQGHQVSTVAPSNDSTMRPAGALLTVVNGGVQNSNCSTVLAKLPAAENTSNVVIERRVNFSPVIVVSAIDDDNDFSVPVITMVVDAATPTATSSESSSTTSASGDALAHITSLSQDGCKPIDQPEDSELNSYRPMNAELDDSNRRFSNATHNETLPLLNQTDGRTA